MNRFLIGIIHLLPHAAMRQPHLAVVGQADDYRVSIQGASGLERVEHRTDILVDCHVQIGVETDIVQVVRRYR